MNEKQRWFKNPFVIAVLVVFSVLVPLTPFFALKVHFFIDRHIYSPVVEMDDSTVYSRDEILEASEVVKDAFYDDFPYSSLDAVAYIDSKRLKDSGQIEFEIRFRTSVFENDAALSHGNDGTVSLWYSCEKTERGGMEISCVVFRGLNISMVKER